MTSWSASTGPTLVVAEAGVNHDGSIDQARRLVDVAAEAGADVVKFQTFRAKSLVTSEAPKARYQEGTTGAGGSQKEMLAELELDRRQHEVLLRQCEDRGIEFLSTPFDIESARFLVNDLGLTMIKVASGEITNGPLLLELARLGTELVVSTGMSSLADVEWALSVLAFGMLRGDEEIPSGHDLGRALTRKESWSLLAERVTLLQCTTEYPASYESTNLRALDTLRQAFGLPTGLSDHTRGIEVPIAAAAREAAQVEKHFTLDRDLPGPDHAASLEPEELTRMIRGIRHVRRALGTGRKYPHAEEWKNRRDIRKGLVARRRIREGEPFESEDVEVKRAPEARSAKYYWSLLGRAAQQDYEAGDSIRERIFPEQD